MRFLASLLRLLGYQFATLTDALRAPGGKFACLTFDGASRDIHRTLFPHLRAQQLPATVFVPTKAVDRAEDGLRWAHLRQLAKAGWEVGSLGHEPVDLAQRASHEQRQLIVRSRQLMVAHLGAPPRVFAYPFGAYDATTLSCLREEGFAAAVTMRPGVNELVSGGEPLQLKRVALSSSTWRDTLSVLKHAIKGAAPAGLRAATASSAVVDGKAVRSGT